MLYPFLSAGPRTATAELPGTHSKVQIDGNRPTLYIRGLTSGLCLVRGHAKRDYRELRLRPSRHIQEGPAFHSADLFAFHLESVAPDIARLTPGADLQPGEYVLVTAPEAGFRWIHFGFGFGVFSGTNPNSSGGR